MVPSGWSKDAGSIFPPLFLENDSVLKRTKGSGVNPLIMPIFFLLGFNSVYKALTLIFSPFFLFISRHWCSFLYCVKCSPALSRWEPQHWCHYLPTSGPLWGSFVYVSPCFPLKTVGSDVSFQRLVWGSRTEWLCIALHSGHSYEDGWEEH